MTLCRVALTSLLVVMLGVPLHADRTHAQNRRARRHYRQGEYEKALEIYDDAVLEAPHNSALRANRASVLHKLERYDKSAQEYATALESEPSRTTADIHYNRGNSLFRRGEKLMRAGDQQAIKAYQAALQEYVKALDLSPGDKDAKWNLQLAHNRIRRLQKMPPQGGKSDKNQDRKNQNDKQQQNQQQRQGDDKQKDEQQPQDNQQGDEQQGRRTPEERTEKTDGEQPPPPRPQPEESDLEREEAARVLRQFADDDKNLNKPEKKAVGRAAQPEKDW